MTIDGDDNLLTNALVKSVESGASLLTLAVSTEEPIPEEGLEITINSDIALIDYFGSLRLPFFSPGGEVLEAIYDSDTGQATGFRFRLDEPNAFINMSVLEDGEEDSPQQATFFLEEGSGYTINEDANASTVTFYDTLEQVPVPTSEPEVSITISETNLIESEGTETTLTFNLSEAPPEEGVLVYVDSGIEGVLSQFDVLNAELTGGVFPVSNTVSSGFYFKIIEPTASITFSPFPDPFVEGIEAYTFSLEENPGYTIAPDASSVDINIADTPVSELLVSLSVEPSTLIESEGTVGVHTFSLSAPPPEEGIPVSVSAPDLGEFNLDAVEVTGGAIAAVTEDGFDLNIIEQEALINLPVADDGEEEGLEEATFTLKSGENYIVNSEASAATLTLVDTPAQISPPLEESEPNDTIPEALDTNLNPGNPNFSISGGIRFDEDFNKPDVDSSEDVDFYSFNLSAKDTVTIDIDSIEYEILPSDQPGTVKFGQPQQLDSELRLFDADGNELLEVNNAAAPGEEAGRDPYIEFTTEETETYYLGVSQLGNRNYDPFVEGSGSGWVFPDLGVYYGDYELEINLESADESVEFVGGDGDNLLEGFGGDDTIAGGFGNDEIFGNGGGDVLRGDANSRSPGGTEGGDDIIYGGAGSDRIGGKAGDDTLYGSAGDDRIWGDAGDDVIKGGLGNDTLDGDASSVGTVGRDTFVLVAGEGTDTILDFQVEADLIGLAEGLTFGQLTITQDGNNAVINFEDETLAIVNRVQATTLTSDLFTAVV